MFINFIFYSINYVELYGIFKLFLNKKRPSKDDLLRKNFHNMQSNVFITFLNYLVVIPSFVQILNQTPNNVWRVLLVALKYM